MAQGEGSDACANAQHLKGTRLGPFTALPNWIAGKVTPNQLAVLWALQLHFPSIRPSVQRLAEIAGMHRATVLKTLLDLEERGWVKRTPRANEQGRQLPNSYELLIWPTSEQIEQAIGVRPEPSKASKGEGSPKTTPGVALDDGGGSLTTTHGGSPTTTQRRTREQQDQLEEIQRPLTPQVGNDDRPSRANGTNPRATGENPRATGENPRANGTNPRTDPYSRKTLPDNAIPNDLLDLQELLPEWWGVKKGVRSAKVFMRVCNKLRPWAQEQRRSALESAIAGGWADIYPPKTLSAPSGRPRNPDGTLMTECDIAIAQHAAYDAAKDQFLREHPGADSKDLPPSWLAFR
jgi:hypothetical protein